MSCYGSCRSCGAECRHAPGDTELERLRAELERLRENWIEAVRICLRANQPIADSIAVRLRALGEIPVGVEIRS